MEKQQASRFLRFVLLLRRVQEGRLPRIEIESQKATCPISQQQVRARHHVWPRLGRLIAYPIPILFYFLTDGTLILG